MNHEANEENRSSNRSDYISRDKEKLMFIKMRLAPVSYAHEEEIADYHVFEVPDDFSEWSEDDKGQLLDELQQEAISKYVEIDVSFHEEAEND